VSRKLLFDQNISWRILELVPHDFPDSSHVSTQKLSSASDAAVWEFARHNSFCIVSKDADFHQMSFVFGAPPKAIWLRLGNCSTAEVANCINRNVSRIKIFLDDSESAFLVLE
jgi:predicted nuclease of predicted toxin-antitoxin system